MKVTFFPRNDYPNNVEVCTHRLGRKMTYTEDTDGYRNDAIFDWLSNTLLSTHNIKYSIFFAQSNGNSRANQIKQYIQQNKVWLDMYYISASSSGGTISLQEYEEARDNIISFINDNFGIRPVAFSYGYGNTSFSEYAKSDFLGGRNSGNALVTDYGIDCGNPNNEAYSLSRFISKPSTTRWFNDARDVRGAYTGTAADFAARLATLSDQIDATMQNNGWFNNFTHIHDVYSYQEPETGNYVARDAYEDYFEMLAQKNSNNEIYFAGYGEAVAYLAYRSMIKRVAMFSPVANPQDELIIRIETDNSILGVDTSLLNVPISVKFSTANTPLEGQTIRSSRNLISLGNNQYIVEIPYAVYPMAKIEKVSM